MKNKILIFSSLFFLFAFLGTANAQWLTNGNAGITPANFLGTLNNADLVFKTNAIEVGRFTTGLSGMIGKANQINASASAAFAAGKSNSIGANCTASIAIGENNIISSTRGYAIGRANNVSSPDAACFGVGNVASAPLSFAIGHSITNNLPSSILLGLYNSNTMYITEQQVGIRTTTPDPFSTLDVFGDIYSYGVWIGSDKRYKKEIRTLDNALDKILALRGTEYLFRNDEFQDKHFPTGKQVGFIAQEMEKVLPDLVRSNDGARYTVNYVGLIPVLVEAMKEQQSQIEEKDEAISCLQKQMETLEARLARIEASLPQQLVDPRSQEQPKTEKSFGISPNPSTGHFQITLSESVDAETATVLVFDGMGREVTRRAIESGNKTLDFNLDLPNGIYNVSLLSKGKLSATQSLVVAK